MAKTIRVSRTWKLKDYESYRVTVEDDVPEGVDVVTVARQLALDCHGSYNDYLLLVQGGFTQSSDLPRRDGAEQGPSHGAVSPTPASAGAGAGAGAEDPGVPPAKGLVPPFAVGEPQSGHGPGTVTEKQLEALHILMARTSAMSKFVNEALVRLKAGSVEEISSDAAAALIGKLNNLGPED